MITDFIQFVVDRKNLTEAEAREVMNRIMSGEASDIEIAAFLTALRMKGETVDELVGFARVMREKAVEFWDGDPVPVVDTCGTGGDRSGTFNISTAAAFVVAGAGAKVAKHGNRSISSRSGSADVLEALGIDIQMPPARLRQAIDEVGIAFLFAQSFHRSMKYVMPARSAIRIRTVFNFLGPLSNPARAQFQVVGVNDAAIVELIASALGRLGVDHAFVVHGEGGLDEVSIAGPTSVVEVRDNDLRHRWVKPEDFGIPTAPLESIRGGDPADNAGIIRDVLSGQPGPHRDAVLINAIFAIVAAGLAPDLPPALAMARESIDSGRAMAKLDGLRALSRS